MLISDDLANLTTSNSSSATASILPKNSICSGVIAVTNAISGNKYSPNFAISPGWSVPNS